MKLYEIDMAIEKAIADATDPETGEIIDSTLSDKLVILTEQKKHIAINVALAIKNRYAESDMIDAELRVLKARKRILDNQAERIKKYLQEFVPEGEKISDGRAVISWRKSESVEISDSCKIEELPDSMVRINIEPSLTSLKTAIKNGAVFQGVEIVQKNNIQVK